MLREASAKKRESLCSFPAPWAFISEAELLVRAPLVHTPPKASATFLAHQAVRDRCVHLPRPCSLGCTLSQSQPPRLARSVCSETAFSLSLSCGILHALPRSLGNVSGGPDEGCVTPGTRLSAI